ncbi:flavohemoglobin expression-modulating QEGLA motif protein [Rhizobium sp. Root1220]|uniref:flavohemoglobin expression-modulating QEGLA motif protein n=1 Tax=Rhizobium sp. Root1220 TaxID=1736432 RepID=UPI0007006D05|nr:flavohemoglobin expression-modulating QEGLA motif protein [Rhizobium sp. Root1220]KQV81865.1 hypothetical protein ASC90_24740 [Rhizobium sp. Root1220]
MTSVAAVAQQTEAEWLDDVVKTIRAGKPVRRELTAGGTLHMDRPLPFLCLHIGSPDKEPVALAIAQANASYLIADSAQAAGVVINALAPVMRELFGGFIVVDIGELEDDRPLPDDAPFLRSFEVCIWETPGAGANDAANSFSKAVLESEARFRRPRVQKQAAPISTNLATIAEETGCSAIVVRFAPVYRQADGAIYPELRDRLIAMIFDASLRACASFIQQLHVFTVPTHRSLGRKAFVDAVSRVDRAIDDVASSFDFLLAITPINADAAFEVFRDGNCRTEPTLLYRPLTMQVETAKKKLFSISFDHMEDPLLYDLYREKQRELDLQLSLIGARETARFIELGRALYGPVEPALLKEANTILRALVDEHAQGTGRQMPLADGLSVARSAATMIESYQQRHVDFEASVELRDDLPSGLMVTGPRLLVSTHTLMDQARVEPLLSHEIGVHLLTYFNGSSQGLRLFRSGLSGYEGMQEGLAVFAEYLAGGMTSERLKLIAARVVGCAHMLEGASFAETFSLLQNDHGFTTDVAFNITLRLYRGGGLAKDAIYLRGLLELLGHLSADGALDPFWMGKIASLHFDVMQELASRGLLRHPSVRPIFLEMPSGQIGLERARLGMRPLDMIQQREP